MRDFPEKLAPLDEGASELREIMSALGQESALPSGADDPRVDELLTRWDELPAELLTELEQHPVHGPRLEHLRRAEAFLDSCACPESSDLYDFAREPRS